LVDKVNGSKTDLRKKYTIFN